ncbi:hypothetical protein Q9S36_22220 [Microbacterium sp. ARD31]|uniref:DUF6767 domain-containing protein n=1 Tax=Microbacterium sp. ARD31 TaxID=2962576 RepID=UPI002881D862|nr:DUF6767 domain-containing protein [Microbacterium sp. ARD31]MDT0182898.1 hypothetical protein [Microbacterium sp. ARD31]
MTTVAARCPLRPGDFCSLCVPGATGPQDCPTVAEVMRDPDLRDRLAELRREAALSPPGRRRG